MQQLTLKLIVSFGLIQSCGLIASETSPSFTEAMNKLQERLSSIEQQVNSIPQNQLCRGEHSPYRISKPVYMTGVRTLRDAIEREQNPIHQQKLIETHKEWMETFRLLDQSFIKANDGKEPINVGVLPKIARLQSLIVLIQNTAETSQVRTSDQAAAPARELEA